MNRRTLIGAVGMHRADERLLPNVSYGSKAAATDLTFGVRSYPKSGHRVRRSGCPLWAITRHHIQLVDRV
jgi:hypothetical protein